MPFRSEKQRRFLWAAHPDIAKRWAHEYPTKKKLPLYAHSSSDDKGKRSKSETPENTQNKTATLSAMDTPMRLANINDSVVNMVGLRIYNESVKKADSTAVKVTIPTSDKPVAAGDSHISVKNTDENNPAAELCDDTHSPDQQHANALMAKLSVVLSQGIQQAVADEEARQQGAEAPQIPQNSGLKTYPTAQPGIAPPMGMTQQPAQAQAQQAQQQSSGTLPPVGGGTSPSANPINSYGGISVNGDINGNAAFGAPGGGKSAGALGLWDRIRAKKERGEKPARPGSKDYPSAKSWKKVTSISEKKSAESGKCSCGCGDTVSTCKCGPACSCRKSGGSCYKGEKKAGTPAWQRSAGKNDEGGLNEKGRKSYEREHGGNLKAPVTESNPKGDRAKRQNSFCSRMCGMKRVNTGSKAKKDPDSRINKSLRKWNCKCSSAMEFGAMFGKAAGLFSEAPTYEQTGRAYGGSVGGALGATGGIGGSLAAAGKLADPTVQRTLMDWAHMQGMLHAGKTQANKVLPKSVQLATSPFKAVAAKAIRGALGTPRGRMLGAGALALAPFATAGVGRAVGAGVGGLVGKGMDA